MAPVTVLMGRFGGEFLIADRATYQRVAHLRTFGLPGGQMAVREPRRSAIGLLYELWGDALFEREDLAPLRSFSPQERAILQTLLQKRLHTPRTSSMGRFFDAVAAILDLCQMATFEGQAAMAVEFAQRAIDLPSTQAENSKFKIQNSKFKIQNFPVNVSPSGSLVVDWEPWLQAMLADLQQGKPIGEIAAHLHQTLARAIVAVAERVAIETVVLSGGCFQNRTLTEQAIAALRQAGFRPVWPQRIPPNDGGIALGQAVVSLAQFHH